MYNYMINLDILCLKLYRKTCHIFCYETCIKDHPRGVLTLHNLHCRNSIGENGNDLISILNAKFTNVFHKFTYATYLWFASHAVKFYDITKVVF